MVILGKETNDDIGVQADHSPLAPRAIALSMASSETGFLGCLNPGSLSSLAGWVEPALSHAPVGEHFQFERLGYFAVDRDSTSNMPVFNLTVNLRDTWAKIERKSM